MDFIQNLNHNDCHTIDFPGQSSLTLTDVHCSLEMVWLLYHKLHCPPSWFWTAGPPFLARLQSHLTDGHRWSGCCIISCEALHSSCVLGASLSPAFHSWQVPDSSFHVLHQFIIFSSCTESVTVAIKFSAIQQLFCPSNNNVGLMKVPLIWRQMVCRTPITLDPSNVAQTRNYSSSDRTMGDSSKVQQPFSSSSDNTGLARPFLGASPESKIFM